MHQDYLFSSYIEHCSDTNHTYAHFMDECRRQTLVLQNSHPLSASSQKEQVINEFIKKMTAMWTKHREKNKEWYGDYVSSDDVHMLSDNYRAVLPYVIGEGKNAYKLGIDIDQRDVIVTLCALAIHYWSLSSSMPENTTFLRR